MEININEIWGVAGLCVFVWEVYLHPSQPQQTMLVLSASLSTSLKSLISFSPNRSSMSLRLSFFPQKQEKSMERD